VPKARGGALSPRSKGSRVASKIVSIDGQSLHARRRLASSSRDGLNADEAAKEGGGADRRKDSGQGSGSSEEVLDGAGVMPPGDPQQAGDKDVAKEEHGDKDLQREGSYARRNRTPRILTNFAELGGPKERAADSGGEQRGARKEGSMVTSIAVSDAAEPIEFAVGAGNEAGSGKTDEQGTSEREGGHGVAEVLTADEKDGAESPKSACDGLKQGSPLEETRSSLSRLQNQQASTLRQGSPLLPSLRFRSELSTDRCPVASKTAAGRTVKRVQDEEEGAEDEEKAAQAGYIHPLLLASSLASRPSPQKYGQAAKRMRGLVNNCNKTPPLPLRAPAAMQGCKDPWDVMDDVPLMQRVCFSRRKGDADMAKGKDTKAEQGHTSASHRDVLRAPVQGEGAADTNGRMAELDHSQSTHAHAQSHEWIGKQDGHEWLQDGHEWIGKRVRRTIRGLVGKYHEVTGTADALIAGWLPAHLSVSVLLAPCALLACLVFAFVGGCFGVCKTVAVR
jgi:hypothetical protein